MSRQGLNGTRRPPMRQLKVASETEGAPDRNLKLTLMGSRRTATEESRRGLMRNASLLLVLELRLPFKLSSYHLSCVRRPRQRTGNLSQSTTSEQRCFYR